MTKRMRFTGLFITLTVAVGLVLAVGHPPEARAQDNSEDSQSTGICVNVEGSDDSNGDAQIPDGPFSVQVSVHADSSGEPGDRLFDLVSPDEYAAGEIAFFEAPPDTTLQPGASYWMVWQHISGESHRLQRTSSDCEDSGRLSGFGIADGSLSAINFGQTWNTFTTSLEIAVYGEAVEGVTGPLLVSNLEQSPATAGEVTQQYSV